MREIDGVVNMSAQSNDDIRRFAKKLELLKMNDIDFLFYEMLPLCGVGASVAFSRFLTLHNKICFGSFALINAYKKEHTGLWGDSTNNNIWYRSMYLETAIMAYNSIEDYIYMVLYFNFDLYEKMDNYSIKNKEDIIERSKEIKGKTKSNIDTWLYSQYSTKQFHDDFQRYKDSTGSLRELANDIKHRGCREVDGIDLPRVTRVKKVIDDNEVDITELVSPYIISIDEEINNLAGIHEKSLEIQKKLYRLCDFKGQLKTLLNNQVK